MMEHRIVPVRRITRLIAKVFRMSAGGFTTVEKRILVADLLSLAADIAGEIEDMQEKLPIAEEY